MELIEQAALQLMPPYGTRILQHLHHVDLIYAKRDIAVVIEWVEKLRSELLSVQSKMISEVTTPCTNCENGHILDTNRISEVFPNGTPVNCPICSGTGQVRVNDIIGKVSEESKNLNVVTQQLTKGQVITGDNALQHQVDKVQVIHVQPDDGGLPPLIK